MLQERLTFRFQAMSSQLQNPLWAGSPVGKTVFVIVTLRLSSSALLFPPPTEIIDFITMTLNSGRHWHRSQKGQLALSSYAAPARQPTVSFEPLMQLSVGKAPTPVLGTQRAPSAQWR